LTGLGAGFFGAGLGAGLAGFIGTGFLGAGRVGSGCGFRAGRGAEESK
jgi:hypothetical protein